MSYTIAINKQFNSLEISFTEKPGEAVRNILKSFNFRWNHKRSIWYGFAELEEIEKALNGEKAEPKAKANKTQKELKENYMDIIKKEVWENDERMQEYARKQCEYVVELSNGNIIDIDKPRIETSFCFGMGMYATYTQEEFERAEKLADNARKNVDYFISENMKQITEKIDCLNEALDNKREVYTFVHYSGQPEDSELVAYNCVRICDNPEFAPYRYNNLKAVRKLSNEDIQAIIDGLEEVAKKFIKRLNTYLKRYGLEKLNVWTYCID